MKTFIEFISSSKSITEGKTQLDYDWGDHKTYNDSLLNKLENHYDYNKLRPSEKKRLKQYHGISPKKLRNINDNSDDEKVRSISKTISKLHDTHKLPQNLTTYKSVGFDPRKAEGANLHFPNATFSSISKYVWGGASSVLNPDNGEHEHHVLTFHMPKGSGGYYLGKKHEEQGTFLMKPGTTFKKVKEPEEFKGPYGTSTFVHHYAPVEEN